MKIKVSQLRKIIKEEVSKVLNEGMSFDDLIHDQEFLRMLAVEKMSLEKFNKTREQGGLPPLTDEAAVFRMQDGLSSLIKRKMGVELSSEETVALQDKLRDAMVDPTITVSAPSREFEKKMSYPEKEVHPRAKALARASAQGRKWIPGGRKIGF